MILINEENYLTLIDIKNPSEMKMSEKYQALCNMEFCDKEIFDKFMTLFCPELDLRNTIEAEQKIRIIKTSTIETQEISDLFIYLKLHEIEALMESKEYYTDEVIYALLEDYCNKNYNKNIHAQHKFIRNKDRRLRFIYPPIAYQTILRIANCNEELIKYLIKTTDKLGFFEKVLNLSEHKRNILILSYYTFPKGGGEQHTWEQVCLLTELGYSVIWISEFSNNLKNEFRIERVFQNYTSLKPELGKMVEEIKKAVIKYKPVTAIIFGHEFLEWKKVIENSNIRAYLYHHFWTYWIKYYPNMNIDMDLQLENFQYKDTGVDSNTIHIFPSMRVAEICIKGNNFSNIQSKLIPPFPIEIYEKLELSESAEKIVFRVLLINCRINKGGKKLLEIATNLGSGFEFVALNNELDVTDLEDRNLLSQLHKMSNVTVIDDYLSSKDIFRDIDLTIIPSLVEETYGRVFFESISKDVPCLVSSESIKNLDFREKYDFVLTKKDDWVEKISMLKHNSSKLTEILEIQKSIYAFHSINRLDFVNELHSYISSEKSKRIGFFSLWEVQGLGKLTKHYYETLELLGYEVFVFAYMPYFEQFYQELNSAPDRYAGKRIYQSYNTREQVPTSELINFIKANKINVLIVPEICFQINWSRLRELYDMNIEIISIPMIEIVRSDELMLHNSVSKNWMLTDIGQELFKELGINNTIRIRYRPLNLENM